MTAGRRLATFLFALPMAVTVPIAAAATPPSPPPIVRAVAVTPSQIVLEWESGGPDVTSYTVRRDGAVLASVNPATLTFSDSTVLAGRRYTYVIEAVSPGGTAASAAIRVKTPSPPERQDHNRPTVPEDVHAVALADGSVLVDWQGSNDDSDISAYVIRRGNRHVATVNSGTLAFIDTRKDSAPGSYTVEAVDITGLRSGRSDEAPVETTTAGATAASPGTRSSGTAAQTGSLSTAAFSPSLRRYPYLTDVVNSADSRDRVRDDQLGDGSVVHECGSCVGRCRRRRIVLPDDLGRGHAYTDHGELGRPLSMGGQPHASPGSGVLLSGHPGRRGPSGQRPQPEVPDASADRFHDPLLVRRARRLGPGRRRRRATRTRRTSCNASPRVG